MCIKALFSCSFNPLSNTKFSQNRTRMKYDCNWFNILHSCMVIPFSHTCLHNPRKSIIRISKKLFRQTRVEPPNNNPCKRSASIRTMRARTPLKSNSNYNVHTTQKKSNKNVCSDRRDESIYNYINRLCQIGSVDFTKHAKYYVATGKT